MLYEVCVSYPMDHYPAYDDRIESLAGKWANASGVSITSPETRDLVFSYREEEPAMELVSTLLHSKLRQLRVSVIPRD